MSGIRRVLFSSIAVAVWVAGFTARANDSSSDNLATRLHRDMSDGSLDDFSLLDAALIASGVDRPEQLASLRNRFDRVASLIQSEVKQSANRDQALACILSGMHRHMLTSGYLAESSAVDRAIEAGSFNCVSATIVFRCLCDRFGVECDTIASREHVLCRGVRPPRFIETTSPTGAAAARATPSSDLKYRPENRDFRELSDVQLLAKIYYNEGVEQLESRNFSEAASRLRSAWNLDREDTAARQNLLAALNNWALHLCDRGDFEESQNKLQQIWEIDPRFSPALVNDLYLHQRWARVLCGENRFDEAVAILESGRQRRPEVEFFARGQLAVYSLWAQAQFVEGDYVAGWETLRQVQACREFPEVWESAVHGAYRMLLEDGQAGAAELLIEVSREFLTESERKLFPHLDLPSDNP